MTDDRGSSVVDFALVTPLLVAVLLTVVHVAVWVGQRSAAMEAAFTAARAGARTPGTASERTRAAVREAQRAMPDAEQPPRVRVDRVAGHESVLVDLAVPLRVLGVPVPVGPVTSHMAIEPR